MNKVSGISQLASQYSQMIPLHKWVLGPFVITYHAFILSLHLHSMLNRVTTYCSMLWTREWYQLISMCKSKSNSWEPHNKADNQHGVQPHSTKSIPAVKFLHPLNNSKQLHHYLPQWFTHILIIYLLWCFGTQGYILSTNPALQVAPAIGLDVHLGVARCTGR